MKRKARHPEHPNADDQDARGIIIQPGREELTPVACWAYMWSADDDAVDHHWHELVPMARTP